MLDRDILDIFDRTARPSPPYNRVNEWLYWFRIKRGRRRLRQMRVENLEVYARTIADEYKGVHQERERLSNALHELQRLDLHDPLFGGRVGLALDDLKRAEEVSAKHEKAWLTELYEIKRAVESKTSTDSRLR